MCRLLASSACLLALAISRLAAHGARDMPVWGDLWLRNVPEQYVEYSVRGGILELLLYLDAIQE